MAATAAQGQLVDPYLIEANRRMSISTPFIRRPIGTSLLTAAILLAGIAAYPLLPVAPLPQVDFPTISVTAKLPGANPQTMASTVAQPLETQFAQIAGVSQMTSISVLGQTAITLQFDLEPQHRRRRARRAGGINAAARAVAEDPAEPADLRKVNPSDSPILILAVQSDELPSTESTTTPTTSWRSRSRRSPASPRCSSAASASARCASRSTRRSWRPWG